MSNQEGAEKAQRSENAPQGVCGLRHFASSGCTDRTITIRTVWNPRHTISERVHLIDAALPLAANFGINFAGCVS